MGVHSREALLREWITIEEITQPDPEEDHQEARPTREIALGARVGGYPETRPASTSSTSERRSSILASSIL